MPFIGGPVLQPKRTIPKVVWRWLSRETTQKSVQRTVIQMYAIVSRKIHTIFSISRNHVSLLFYIVNTSSCTIHVMSEISREITLKLASFSLKITINGENCHSQFSHLTQMVKCEITFMLVSRKFIFGQLYISHVSRLLMIGNVDVVTNDMFVQSWQKSQLVKIKYISGIYTLSTLINTVAQNLKTTLLNNAIFYKFLAVKYKY